LRQLTRDPNSLAGVASYIVISKHLERTGSPPTGLYFNKIMSLLHSEARTRGIDLQLPHCWYRWGDEVVRYLMPTAIDWNHEDPNQTRVSWKGDVPFYQGLEDNLGAVKDLADELTAGYSCPGGIERAVSEVYARAPFDFQRRYKICRDSLYGIQRSRVEMKDYGKAVLLPMFDAAFEVFPASDFPEVPDRILAFRELLRLMLQRPEPDFALVNEVSEEFWFWFCYRLRLHPAAHENVPRLTIDFWEERLEFEDDRYRKMLGDHAAEILEATDSPLLEPLIRVRKAEGEEYRRVLESFGDGFDGLGEFVEGIRKGYRPR